MDILCPVCAEPWENDTLHDLVGERTYPDYQAASAAFRSKGCEAMSGETYGNVRHNDTKANPAIAMLYDLMGDDMDGAASSFDMLPNYGMEETE